MSDCCTKYIDPSCLFGPGRTDAESHVFAVKERFMQITASKMPDCACIYVERVTKFGKEYCYEPAQIRGACRVINACNPSLIITEPGRYRLVLECADPEDVFVKYEEVMTPITSSIDDKAEACCGGGGLSVADVLAIVGD